jgi:hypothetical protein
MTFVKGQVGNPLGRRGEKPFLDALRLEIAAAGENHYALRRIARNLLKMAQQPSLKALPAVMALADRLDGKPAQESMLTVEKRDATDWSRAELVAFLNDAAGGRGISQANGSSLPALPAPPTFQTRHRRG